MTHRTIREERKVFYFVYTNDIIRQIFSGKTNTEHTECHESMLLL